MVKDPYHTLGINLEIARNRLLFPRDLMAKKAGISSRSLERIEKNDKYANTADRDKYIDFLGLSQEVLVDKSFDYTWQELIHILEKRHPNNHNIIDIPLKKLSALRVIKYRALPENLLLKPISAKQLTEDIRDHFKYVFENNIVQNALNNLSADGTIEKINTSPIEYYLPIKNFPKHIDPLYELVQHLSQITENYESNLVNKSLRTNAKILMILARGRKSRSGIFEELKMSNETNNVRRTIHVLEKFELILKTELAPRSSKQMYQISGKGEELLRKAGEGDTLSR